jgi:hypothetical protein
MENCNNYLYVDVLKHDIDQLAGNERRVTIKSGGSGGIDD